ncbi:MAG: aminoglycoside phosphotransferase family protein [Clostridia bacterium]|nr:aminoglycoside phosphotransferase family protein [Clostridia bacterium]
MRMFDVGEGLIDLIEIFGEGRINHTYKITLRDGLRRSEYLLQSINTFVFQDASALMENLAAVTKHIKQNNGRSIEYIRCKQEGNDDVSYVYIGEDGKAWRMYHYIDADVYQCIVHPYHAYMLGQAIADFSKALSTFDASSLVETIPDFHNTPKRFSDFLLSVTEDVISGDCRSKKDEETVRQIKFVLERKDKFGILAENQKSGALPIRVTHNDPKISNVLVDKKTNVPICMIDLDTCMPGTILYDVGDALRSVANTASEDEKDASLVDFSTVIFESFVRGFLKGMSGLLTDAEIELIPYSVWILAMELGMRFLKDHIDGNKYFKTQYDGQNLERARIQFKLAEVVEQKIEDGELSGIVYMIVSEMQKRE